MVAVMSASSEIWQEHEVMEAVSVSETNVCMDKNSVHAKTRWDWKAHLEKVQRSVGILLLWATGLLSASSCTNQSLTTPVTDAKGRSEPTTLTQPVVANTAQTKGDALLPADALASIPVATENPVSKPVMVASADDILPPDILAAVSTNDSASSAAPEVKDGEIVPPERLSAFFTKLGYDTKALAGVEDVVQKMETAKQTLGDKVVLGAMISESQIDKPKILKKNPTNNPQETFALVTGVPDLTMDNRETVFTKILSDGVDAEIDAEQVASYQTMVTNLGPEMTKEWFKTFNVVVKKMPAQNKYLLQQAFLTTSSVYAYADEKLRANLDASLVADQVWRLILLVTNKDDNVVVARLMYGDTVDTAFSRRIPNHQVLKAVFDKVGIVLPESLYDIAGPGAQAMGINTNKYVDGIKNNEQLDKDIENGRKNIAQNRQASAQNRQEAAKLHQYNVYADSLLALSARVERDLPAFVLNPTPKLEKRLQADYAEIQSIRAQFEALFKEQKTEKFYTEAMSLIAEIEKKLVDKGFRA